jgi:hypothetical protein
VAGQLESASDALMHAALHVRDVVLDTAMHAGPA